MKTINLDVTEENLKQFSIDDVVNISIVGRITSLSENQYELTEDDSKEEKIDRSMSLEIESLKFGDMKSSKRPMEKALDKAEQTVETPKEE